MTAADGLVSYGGGLFTGHDMFGAFVVGIGLGTLFGALCVAVLLKHVVERDIDEATTLPRPDEQPAPPDDDVTARIEPAVSLADFPRRTGTTWTA